MIDGVRHERAAWSYEAPRPAMKQVAGRFGFWKDVEVANHLSGGTLQTRAHRS